jgi:hypothetical protein
MGKQGIDNAMKPVGSLAKSWGINYRVAAFSTGDRSAAADGSEDRAGSWNWKRAQANLKLAAKRS